MKEKEHTSRGLLLQTKQRKLFEVPFPANEILPMRCVSKNSTRKERQTPPDATFLQYRSGSHSLIYNKIWLGVQLSIDSVHPSLPCCLSLCLLLHFGIFLEFFDWFLTAFASSHLFFVIAVTFTVIISSSQKTQNHVSGEVVLLVA